MYSFGVIRIRNMQYFNQKLLFCHDLQSQKKGNQGEKVKLRNEPCDEAFIILKSKLEQKQELDMGEQCSPFGIGPKLAVVQVVQVVSKKAKKYHV